MYVSVVSPRRHHPPIWVWCRACQPDPVGTAAVSALCSTSCVIRTAQVTGPFDPLPSSVPSREVHGRPAAGTSQVSQRPAELAQHRPAGLSVAGRCILPPMRRPGSRGLLPGGSVQSDPISAGLPRLPLDPAGHAWARPATHQWPSGSLAGSSPRTAAHRNRGASGSVNRWLRPDSVRHMSVTTATQRHITKHGGTITRRPARPRKPSSRAVSAGGGRWWQVLGSNQRRLSRRFYSEPIPAHRNTH